MMIHERSHTVREMDERTPAGFRVFNLESLRRLLAKVAYRVGKDQAHGLQYGTPTCTMKGMMAVHPVSPDRYEKLGRLTRVACKSSQPHHREDQPLL
jgi:hypothetical protein